MGESGAEGITEFLASLGFVTGRLKTGTPPRVDARSVDFSKLDLQKGDDPLPRLSFWSAEGCQPKQVPCHITHTTEKTKNKPKRLQTLAPVQ